MSLKKGMRLVAALLCCALLFGALPVVSALAETALTPPAAGSSSAYINASGVNFRTGPSTKYSSQGKLDANTAVTVLGTSGSWYKLTVDSTGKSGYVFSRYVTLGSAPAASTPTTGTTGTNGYINASGVNFRTGPSTQYSSQGKLALNTAVTVIGTSGSWYKLTVDSTGKSGYVFSRYVTLNSTPATPSSGSAGYVNTDSVHLRTGPSATYTSLALLEQGTAVTVTATSGSWYKLTVNATGQTGYVYASYITMGSSPVNPVTPTSEQAGIINGRNVNFRSGPSTKYTRIGLLKRDAPVTVLATSGNWYQVRADATGQVGYVYALYVTLEGGSSSTAAPSTAAPTTPADGSGSAPQAPVRP